MLHSDAATSTAFQNALIAGDLAAIRRCPKSDLHNHGVLGGDPTQVVPGGGHAAGPLKHRLDSMDDMHRRVGERYGEKSSDPTGRIELIEAAFAQAATDGITRLETGDDVWAMTLFGQSAAKLTEQLKAAHERAAPNVEWLPSLEISRHCSFDDITCWLEPFLDLEFFNSIDLSGDEFAQPIESFKPVFRMAKTHGLRLKAHVGEWGDADSVWRAVEELELDEVQHGIAAADSKAVMTLLADNQIVLNICPTSNVILGRVESLAVHPIQTLFNAGVTVTINTDDMLVFGQSVSQEFLNVYRSGCLDAKQLDQIRRNGLEEGSGHLQ